MSVMIVSSELVSVSPQTDGRSWIDERHVDNYGREYRRTYLADADADLSGALAAYALTILPQRRTAEIAANIDAVLKMGLNASPVFEYSTMAENVTVMASNLSSAEPWQTVMLAQYISSLSPENQQANVGMTPAQVSLLEDMTQGVFSQMQALETLLSEIAAQVGA